MAEALRDTGWFKSSHSGAANDQCVEVRISEVGTGWFKSSHSAAASDTCVEVRITETTIGVRDSKNPAGPSLRLHSPAWTTFLASVRA